MDMEPKSKSQLKREMLALQSLGEKLVDLSQDQITNIGMPPELQEAVLFARTIKRGEARRRQLQYIGSLMREVDPEPIRKAVEDISRGRLQDAGEFKELERWRDGLVGGNTRIIEEIVNKFPDANRQELSRLALSAAREREGNKPPKASRALFRLLRGLKSQ
jgi:ribosome-associated protein